MQTGIIFGNFFQFQDTLLWPDFNKKELEKAIAYYNKRDRRFGGVK